MPNIETHIIAKNLPDHARSKPENEYNVISTIRYLEPNEHCSGHSQVMAEMTQQEYTDMGRIADQVAQDALIVPHSDNPDASNISTAMKTALIKAKLAGHSPSRFAKGTSEYTHILKAAQINQLQPHQTLTDILATAIIQSTQVGINWVQALEGRGTQQGNSGMQM